MIDQHIVEQETDTSRISVTAHYTSHVWVRNDLSANGFATPSSKFIYWGMEPIMWFLRNIAGGDMEIFLLQRHRVIDHFLKEAIEQDGVTQVLEIACGLSPRGTRFMQEYGAEKGLTYIEADLPDMAGQKRRLLRDNGSLSDQHRVINCNVLEMTGDASLESIFDKVIDKNQKTVVITEGLVNYFDLPTISGVWTRLAEQLKPLPYGRYLTDLYPQLDWHPAYRYIRFVQKMIGKVARGSFTFHFPSKEAIVAGFEDCGFEETRAVDPAEFYGKLPIPTPSVATMVRLVNAKVDPA